MENSSDIFLIEDEVHALKVKLDEIEDKWRSLGNEKRMAVEQTSETWHDNPAFDEVEMQQRMVSHQQWEISSILNRAKILTLSVLRSRTSNTVTIWKKIVLDIDWEELEYVIWGFMAWEGRISYEAPLVKALIWMEEWEYKEVELWWKVKEIEILSITNI